MQRLSELTAEMRRESAGIDFARRAIALALGSSRAESIGIAAQRWGATSPVVERIRMSAVPGGASDDAASGSHVGDTEFLSLVRERELISRVGLRRVPSNTPIVAQCGAATAFWTASGKAAPLTSAAFTRYRIHALRCPALLVYSTEFFESTDPEVESMLRDDLVRATSEAADFAFVNPSNAGVAGKIPAAVTFDAPTISSSADIGADLSAQIAGQSPVDTSLGPRGGTLLGMPAITSRMVPYDSSGGCNPVARYAGCLPGGSRSDGRALGGFQHRNGRRPAGGDGYAYGGEREFSWAVSGRCRRHHGDPARKLGCWPARRRRPLYGGHL